MNKIDIVSVVNNHNIYEKYFINNSHINKQNLIYYDNSIENIPITKRYNNYLNNKLNDDTWVVFCHQDFEFRENIDNKIKLLDRDSIYGPVGAATKKNFIFFIRFNGIKIAKFRLGFVNKTIIKGNIIEKAEAKQIYAGKAAKDNEIVETLDCCCFIIHSSLIRKINFRFDENLDWHLYSEDLSLFAKTKFNIKSRIINLFATHYSSGNFDSRFDYSLEYLKHKYKNEPIISTVYDGSYMRYLEKL